MQQVNEVRRSEYQVPSHIVNSVKLKFIIEAADRVIVDCALECEKNPNSEQDQLALRGIGLDSASLKVDGKPAVFQLTTNEDGDCALLSDLPARFVVTSSSVLDPSKNTELSGLYLSGGRLFTQCEAEGFRRIAWHPDRPDVLSKWTVEIVGNEDFPVLLSNGNPILNEKLADGRQRVVVEDPHPKPSYLFALVAGKFGLKEQEYVSASGKVCQLRFWADESDVPRLDYAMDSLIRSMRWDERTFGLEIDLDVYNVVAVGDFNMGAMENKGLNVFNTKYVLADPMTATDADHAGVESVIGHEYFHNWTGNRVTVQSWFELTLKEGLTVYRDQEFSADENSRGVCRISDVMALRAAQFREDAGAMSHPIRPDAYSAIDNFYTSTVYEKGSEVVRVYESLLGKEGFRKGMDLYFRRHDGDAVTCNDFLCAMADANGVNLDKMVNWYSQPGTPVVCAEWIIEPSDPELRVLRLTQSGPTGADWKPVPIPVRCGFLDEKGCEIQDTPTLLVLDELSKDFVIGRTPVRPCASLLRGFSAPVRLIFDRPDEELALLAAHDTDAFGRWEALQQIALLNIKKGMKNGETEVSQELFHALESSVRHDDPAMAAFLLTLPSQSSVDDGVALLDPLLISRTISGLSKKVASTLGPILARSMSSLPVETSYVPNGAQAGRRHLRGVLLSYLCKADPCLWVPVAQGMVNMGENLTDRIAGLRCVFDSADRREALLAFETAYENAPSPLVEDKLIISFLGSESATLEDFARLWNDPKVRPARPAPNRIYALLGGLSANAELFHAADGSGYRMLANVIKEIDVFNSTVAARAAKRFSDWRRYVAPHSEKMREALDELSSVELSHATKEIVVKSLI